MKIAILILMLMAASFVAGFRVGRNQIKTVYVSLPPNSCTPGQVYYCQELNEWKEKK